MKQALGKNLWLHKVGEPQELVISSHGYREKDCTAMFSLESYLDGTTLYFMVEDRKPSSARLTQVVSGQGFRGLMHTKSNKSLVYEYYLQKFQKSTRRGHENRHSPEGSDDALESYDSIDQMMVSQNNYIENDEFRKYRQSQINKHGSEGTDGAGDFINRGVITIRSGGPYKQQAVRLSEVIRAAQTPPLNYKIFWCNFCRSIM